jgi:hypothetical protein
MDVTLLKQPFDVAFTGNPMQFVFCLTPYGQIQKSQDWKLQVKVMVEDLYGSGTFTEKRSQFFLPNDKGVISFDIATIVDAYLSFYTPKLSLAKPIIVTDQQKRCKVSYLLYLGSTASGTATDSNIIIATKGGLNEEKWHPTDFFNVAILQNKQSFLFSASGEMFGMSENRYMFWLYPTNNAGVQTVLFNLVYEDDTTDTFLLDPTGSGITTTQWGLCCAPVGPVVLQAKANTAGLLIKRYSVAVMDAGSSIIELNNITIDHRNYYRTSQLYYRNSLGAMEAIRLRGQVDFEADFERQQAQVAMPSMYFQNAIRMAQNIENSILLTTKHSGSTGFLNRDTAYKLVDLYLSKDKYQVNEDGALIPISIVAKNTKFFSNKDNKTALQIEWQQAFYSEYFTPKGVLPTTRVCPSLDAFLIKQINKNSFAILWSMPFPYDKIQVETTVLGVTSVQMYSGNVGNTIQYFTNPNPSPPISITVVGKVVCDDTATPISLGPQSLVTASMIGNSLPIAVSDVYSIVNGFNSAVTLEGSVLDNDYDPDGDSIEVVAASGNTTMGGSYSINSAGIINYQPPSSSFNGIDGFNYNIREVGGSSIVSASVTINVGAAPVIYAKLVTRNQTFYSGYTLAEIWVDFFSDSFGTIPIDVTSNNLTVTVQKTVTNYNKGNVVGTPTVTPMPYTPTGTSYMAFSGVINTSAGTTRTITTFALLTGTGYTVI